MADPTKPWPLGGYAPGGYMCRCRTCEKEFTGDKRAWACLECAVVAFKLRAETAPLDAAMSDRVEDGSPLSWREVAERAETALAEALREMTKYAREAGEAKGRLEMSEAAGIVDGWRERATRAEASEAAMREAHEDATTAMLDQYGAPTLDDGDGGPLSVSGRIEAMVYRAALRWRPEVQAFADLMERELRENDHKGGWAREHPGPLMDRLWEEAHELSVYFAPGSRGDYATWSAQIGSEAADVANFAMMIADVCGALSPTPATQPTGAE